MESKISLILDYFYIKSTHDKCKKDMWPLAKFSHYEELNVNVKRQNKSTIKDVTIYDNKNVTKKWISQLKEKLKPTSDINEKYICFTKK